MNPTMCGWSSDSRRRDSLLNSALASLDSVTLIFLIATTSPRHTPLYTFPKAPDPSSSTKIRSVYLMLRLFKSEGATRPAALPAPSTTMPTASTSIAAVPITIAATTTQKMQSSTQRRHTPQHRRRNSRPPTDPPTASATDAEEAVDSGEAHTPLDTTRHRSKHEVQLVEFKTTLPAGQGVHPEDELKNSVDEHAAQERKSDRKSTRLNSSH